MFKSYWQKAVENLWRHRVALLILFACVLLPMALLEDLVEGVREKQTVPIDNQILLFLHDNATPQADKLISWATIGTYWLAIPLVVGVIASLRYYQRPAKALFFAVAVIGSWLLNVSAKWFFGRTRPALWESILPEKSYSFPSGHSMISAALGFAFVVLLWNTRLRIPALIGAPLCVFLVGVSRLYLGVHYPTDVLAGWCAGTIWATGAFFICRPLAANPSSS